MKLVLQRVKKGSVAIDGKIKGSIGCGFVALVGFGPNDDSSILAAAKGVNIQTGEFGAEMLVEIHNDGPVTIILDSDTDLAKTK